MDIKYNIDDTVCLTGKIEAIQIRKEAKLQTSFNPETVVYYDIKLDDDNESRVRVAEKFIHGTTEDIDLSLIPDEKMIDYLKIKQVISGRDI